jgi:hypothetical protein
LLIFYRRIAGGYVSFVTVWERVMCAIGVATKARIHAHLCVTLNLGGAKELRRSCPVAIYFDAAGYEGGASPAS